MVPRGSGNRWGWRGVAFLVLALAASGCAETEFAIHSAKVLDGDGAAGGGYKLGKPYQVEGVWYSPEFDPFYDETGIASWYGEPFHGRPTANGERFDMNAPSAAHKTLPLPSHVRVTNLENGLSIVLRVNDRGPFVHGRIIDLSRRAAQLLGMDVKGTAKVRVQMLPISQQPEILVAGLRKDGYELPMEENLAIAYSDSNQAGSIDMVAIEAPSSPAPEGGLIASAAAAEPAAPAMPVVTKAAAEGGALYIQAGAFAHMDNAIMLQSELALFGPARISETLLSGQTLYRVRLGPYDDLAAADQALESVIASGHPQARLIVD